MYMVLKILQKLPAYNTITLIKNLKITLAAAARRVSGFRGTGALQ